jgi:hypothetical protein
VSKSALSIQAINREQHLGIEDHLHSEQRCTMTKLNATGPRQHRAIGYKSVSQILLSSSGSGAGHVSSSLLDLVRLVV